MSDFQAAEAFSTVFSTIVNGPSSTHAYPVSFQGENEHMSHTAEPPPLGAVGQNAESCLNFSR